ncbi:MAG: rhodanese-like domain-containing protein [Paludibacter sp.]|nr:rhodanese-like domain-containing protein [Paludibacter sp.]MBP7612247.1 rhodanese-like domain-containing protein [Paludibacter sp.]
MKTKLLLPVIALLFCSFTTITAQNKVSVSSKQVSSMLLKDKKIIVLDVRTAEEFSYGHIKGALNIDIRQPDAFSKIDKLNKNAKYIVHCRTNHRSGIAVNHMIQSGFKNIYQMMDGWSGWSMNNLPVQK